MKLHCAYCGKDFERPNPRGRIPMYCSPSHRQQAWVQKTFIRRDAP